MKSIGCGGENYIPSKVVCVGKNYSDHVVEMGGDASPGAPVIFIKPNSSIAFGNSEIFVPRSWGLLHHEVELCFIAGGEGIIGYGVGIDLTLRDIQSEAKGSGLPWTIAKGFDNAAAFGAFIRSEDVDDPMNLAISLDVSGVTRQRSNTKNMFFKPKDILLYVSSYMTIEDGDVFMCGTPAGVGPLEDGDRVVAHIKGLPKLEVIIRRSL